MPPFQYIVEKEWYREPSGLPGRSVRHWFVTERPRAGTRVRSWRRWGETLPNAVTTGRRDQQD